MGIIKNFFQKLLKVTRHVKHCLAFGLYRQPYQYSKTMKRSSIVQQQQQQQQLLSVPKVMAKLHGRFQFLRGLFWINKIGRILKIQLSNTLFIPHVYCISMQYLCSFFVKIISTLKEKILFCSFPNFRSYIGCFGYFLSCCQ